jgi:serine/threonine protein kinase
MNHQPQGRDAGADRPAVRTTTRPEALEDPRIAGVVRDYQAALEVGQRPDRDELLAQHPALADALAECLDALEFMHAAAPQLQPSDLPHASAACGLEFLPTSPLGDYRLVREIGRGGMGIVYEAEQLSLGRRVALKVLPLAAALDARQLQRFKYEAQAAAHLHHTNIVPVYAVGCERGVHYYAMQFIEGQTLAAVVGALRQRGGKDDVASPPGANDEKPNSTLHNQGPRTATGPGPPGRRLSALARAFWRTAAQWGVQAAEALEHAHQLGVVHRDVKPANLLVDGRGHLWITDFGLARLHNNPSLTRTGDVVGTVRYMSPEQALGQADRVDQRTDVYSLGATLYELLTLEPAFPGRDRDEVLRQITRTEPCPLRRLYPALPAELEVIVLKALAKNPAERYATAQELADDLRHFLDDKPIRARRPTLLQRLRRWARRHRTIVLTAAGTAALGALLALAALGVAYALVARERDEKEAALRTARAHAAAVKQQHELAEANLRLARKAVDEIYLKWADQLAGVPFVEPRQRELLLTALAFYQEFAKQRSTDPAIRLGTAQAYLRVGTIQSALRQRRAAEEAYTQAITLLGQLADEFPATPRYQEVLAIAHLAEGDSLQHGPGGRVSEAERAYRQAHALLTKLAAETPNESAPLYLLALANTKLAEVQRARPRAAEAAVRDALALAEKLVVDFPEHADRWAYRTALAHARCVLAHLVQTTGGGKPEAEKAIREAIALVQPGVAAGHLGSRERFAHASLSLGQLLHVAGRSQEALTAYRQAQPVYEQFVVDLPCAPSYWTALYECYTEQVRALEQLGRRDEVVSLLSRAVDYYERFVAALPADAASAKGATAVARGLASVLREGGPLPEKIAVHRRAGQVAEQLAARFPGRTAHRFFVAYWYDRLGSLLIAAGQTADASSAFARAAAGYRAVLEQDPNHVASLNNLAWLLTTCPAEGMRDGQQAVVLARRALSLAPKPDYIWNTLGLAHYRAGDWPAAIAALEKSRELYAVRPEGNRMESFSTFFLAMVHWQKGDRETARRWYDQAVRWMEQYRPRDEELGRIRAEAAALLGP